MENEFLTPERIKHVKDIALTLGADQDDLQEAYLCVLENKSKFERLSLSFEAWSYFHIMTGVRRSQKQRRIIHTPKKVQKHFDAYALEAKNLIYLDETNDYLLTDNSYNPEEAYIELENKQQLYNAVALLSEREQQIIVMRIFENQTLKFVGKAFGLSKERVRQIEETALLKLKQILEGEENEC